MDEFEVRVPYSQEESQSVFNSSSQSDQQFDQAHYLRSSTSSLVSTFYQVFLCRVLSISTAVSVFGLVTIISAIVLLAIRHRSHGKQPTELKESPDEDESLELVPNITLNPSFNIDMLEHIVPEYTESSDHAFLVRSDN